MSKANSKNTFEMTFVVPGPPVPKKRPRVGKYKTVTPIETKRYEKHVGMIAKVATLKNPAFREIIREPTQIIVDLYIYNLRTYKRAPDADNIIKSVLDGMEGVIYENDRQVLPRVQYVEYQSEKPRVELRITYET